MTFVTWERTLGNRGNLTESNSSVLTITGGTNAVWGTGTTIEVKEANAGQDGYLSKEDYAIFSAPTVSDHQSLSNLELAASGVTYGHVNDGAQTIAGAKTFSTAPILSSLTASEILALDASKNIQTLAVATYPSLTELSYVKGVTSAIQTQIGTKLTAARGNWKIFYSNDTGVFTELALGDAGKVLKSNGAAAAPTWETASGGGSAGYATIFLHMGG